MQALNVPFSYRCTVPVSERCQPALLRQISCKQPSRHIQTHVSSSAAGLPPNADPTARPVGVPETPAAADSAAATTQPKRNLWQKMKYFFVGDKLDKERLKALGMGAFASYGFISNLNYGTALGISWLAFVKKYGVAPTAEGQWPTFLAFYAGMWAIQNFARPLRLSLALALAPAFDRVINTIGDKLHVDKKWAFGVFLVCMACLTTVTLFGTIYLLGGFPSNTVPVSA
eukprot:GHRR01007710.1.p1 GENE.GHRR01007710.1~~GHRR01007710.1.p1  ORF type:complete len:229 (+),score=67.54 GHRR01007710.1:484-1170(+)